jgi:hypothetical protein
MMRRWILVLSSLAGALLIVTTVAYRYAYGTWWQAPERVPYCGRTYLAGTQDLSLADIRQRQSQTALPGDKPYPVVSIGKTPPIVGAEMLAAVTPQAEREKLGLPATMGLYLQTKDGSYTANSLSGGP